MTKLKFYEFILKIVEKKRFIYFSGSIIMMLLWIPIIIILTCGLFCCPFIALFKPEYFKSKSDPKKDIFTITGFTSEYYSIGFTEKQSGPAVINKTIKCTEHVFKDLYGEK